MEGLDFMKELGSALIAVVSGNFQDTSYSFQQISMAVQRR